jgi:HTH-type transcriptional regulator/antitoxin HigA
MLKLSYAPDSAIHPGVTLNETIEALGMSQVDLALRTGLTSKHISQIINEKVSITPETAIKLERVLGVKATFWNNLEKNYRANLARIESQKILADEIQYVSRFSCYNELAAFGMVEKAASKDYLKRAENLLQYFRVDSLRFIPRVECIAFRNMKGDVNQESLAAWLRYGEIEAEKITVGNFDVKKIKESLHDVRKLFSLPDGFPEKLQKLFAQSGVAVVFTPYFKNTKINGATRWMGDKAVVQLNTKGAYADIFWFTLFHEIGHLLLHGKKDQFLEFPQNGERKDLKEKEADDFAMNQLIPSVIYDEVLKGGWSAVRGMEDIDEGILAGRLAHDGKMSWQAARRLRPMLKFIPD